MCNRPDMSASILNKVIVKRRLGLFRSYSYATQSDWTGPDRLETPGPVISRFESYGVRYEMTQQDRDRLDGMKSTLQAQLGSFLAQRNLHFRCRGGGEPQAKPSQADGLLFWEVNNGNTLMFQASCARLTDLKSGSVISTQDPFARVILRFRAVSHDYLKIPPNGAGSGFYIEDLLALLETGLPDREVLSTWKARLVWQCEMVKKYWPVIFSELSPQVVKRIFKAIRMRAVPAQM